MRGKCKTMTRHHRAFAAIAMFAAALASTSVYAFDWYTGASVGNNSYEVTGGDYFPFQTFSGSADGNDGAWKAFLGMRLFEKYVSAEFGYNHLGTASAKGTISGAAVTATSDTRAYTGWAHPGGREVRRSHQAGGGRVEGRYHDNERGGTHQAENL